MRRTAADCATDFDRAVWAEPALAAVVATVDALCVLVRPSDRLCAGCVWGDIVKPMVTPLIGWCRGYAPENAPDVREPRIISAGELMAELDLGLTPAETEIEAWMRTSEAFDVFTGELLRRLDAADPGNGHGIGRK